MLKTFLSNATKNLNYAEEDAFAKKKLKTTTETFIPCNKIPENHFPLIMKWNSTDTQETSKNSRENFVYKHNKHGYRCKEFNVKAQFKIVSIGCSYVYGVGLSTRNIFHNIISEKIQSCTKKKVVNWNLGLPARSNDFISRMTSLCIPVLKPDLLIINLTHISRREYINFNSKSYDYMQNIVPKIIFKGHYKNFSNLISPEEDVINFFKNINIIEMSAKTNNTKILFSCIQENADQVINIMDKKNFIGNLTFVDFARDNLHPGKKSHEILAEKYWSKLLEDNYLDKWK